MKIEMTHNDRLPIGGGATIRFSKGRTYNVKSERGQELIDRRTAVRKEGVQVDAGSGFVDLSNLEGRDWVAPESYPSEAAAPSKPPPTEAPEKPVTKKTSRKSRR